MSYKPEFEVQGAWYDNAQRFATREEAEGSARARFAVWTQPSDWRAVESPDPVTYRRTDAGDEMLSEVERLIAAAAVAVELIDADELEQGGAS